jgi:hypothetical protein
MKDDHVRQSYAGHRSRSYSPPPKKTFAAISPQQRKSNSDSLGTARKTGKLVDVTQRSGGILCTTAMPEIAVRFPLRRTTSGSMHATHTTAAHGRRTARLASPL